MEFLWYCFAGALSGVLGGMGMGGGTILIPLLNIFYNVSQHSAQGLNLISFIPMSVVAIIIHLKNKLVDYSKVLLIVLPGVITCILGCYIARAISGDVLKRCFGGFLLVLSIFQFATQIRKKSN